MTTRPDPTDLKARAKPKPGPKDHKTDTTTVRVALISATATVLVAVITTAGAFASGWLQYRGPGAPTEPAAAAGSSTVSSTASTPPPDATAPSDGTTGDGTGGDQAGAAAPGGTNPGGVPVYLADLDEVYQERKGDLGTGPERVNGVLYEHSVTLRYHCGTEMTGGYNLDRAYRRLTATIGVRDSAPSGPKVSFQVMLDGKQLGQTYRLGLGEVKNLDLDVTGGLRLVFRATVPPESSCDDLRAVWGDARVSY